MALNENNATIKQVATPAPWYSKYSEGISSGLTALNAFVPQPKTYEGPNGGLSMGIDAGMNTAALVASQFGPTGQLVGLGIQGAQVFNNIANKITGIDGMTKFDTIASKIPGLNLALGIGAKKSNTFTNDYYTLALSKFSYGTTNNTFKDAQSKSGKVYSGFSSGARRDANAMIDAAQRQLTQLKYLIKDRDMAMDAMAGSVDMYNRGYANDLMGIDYMIPAAKSGRKIPNNELISRVKKLSSKKVNLQNTYKDGGLFLFDTSAYVPKKKVRTIEELGDYALKMNPRFIQRLLEEPKAAEFIDKNGRKGAGSHLLSYATSKINGKDVDIVFPEIQEDETGKLKWYDKEAYDRAMKNKDILILEPGEGEVFTTEYKKYPRFDLHMKAWQAKFPYYKNGGSIIPEGALHAHLNHLDEVNPDLKGDITSKGIPVVTEEQGGTVQLAEIERGEIIFQKSVTDKVEELYKKYYSEDTTEREKEELAIKAGKLIAKEIMENTDDKVGLINEEVNL